MNISDFTSTTLVFITIFTGCYIYFTWELPFRFGHPLAILSLAAGIAFFYVRTDSSLHVLLVRYLTFFLIYAIWSLVFLRIAPQYALYLSVFITVFMGIWVSCVQVVLYSLHIDDRTLLTLCTGTCRILSIVLIKRYFVKVDASRSITVHEMLVSLFPALACFIANIEVYDYLNILTQYHVSQNTLLIHLSVVFFGFSAMLVLLSSESYFNMISYREENERAQNQLNAQYQLFLREKDNAEKLRAFQHDLKNHLDTIEAMSQPNEIRTYISNLREAQQETDLPLSTGCPTLDALLIAKLPLLKEKGIQLSCLLHYTKVDFLSPMELCTLFSNSLDNAIEAVSSLPPEKRTISLSGGEYNNHMILRMENPFEHALQKKDSFFETTKADKEAHGYGFSNMRRIIELHNGTITYKTENGVFSLFFMIPLPD